MSEIIRKPWTEIPANAKVVPYNTPHERLTGDSYQIVPLVDGAWALRRYIDPLNPDCPMGLFHLPWWVIRLMQISTLDGKTEAQARMRQALGMEVG
jgi:hypothetical protein